MASRADYAGGRDKIDIGRVIGETFRVIGRDLKSFVTIALTITIGGLGVVALGGFAFLGTMGDFSPQSASSGIFSSFGVIGGVVGYVLISLAGQAALVAVAVGRLGGQPITIGAALAQGFSRLLALLGAALLSWPAIGIAAMFLWIPGLLLLAAWSVATPAIVVERMGMIRGLRRSFDLTRGSLWRIVALTIILFAGIFMFNILNTFIGVGLSAIGVVGAALGFVLQLTAMLAISMVSAAGVAALYVELRTVREGGLSGDLADVFV